MTLSTYSLTITSATKVAIKIVLVSDYGLESRVGRNPGQVACYFYSLAIKVLNHESRVVWDRVYDLYSSVGTQHP